MHSSNIHSVVVCVARATLTNKSTQIFLVHKEASADLNFALQRKGPQNIYDQGLGICKKMESVTK